MKYITEFFNDKHNFFNEGTIMCIIILLIIFILDCFTTTRILLLGGQELNPIMIYFVQTPILLGFIKMTAANAIICLIKISYDIIQDNFYTKYNILCIYFAFAIPSGLTLFIVIHNFGVLI